MFKIKYSIIKDGISVEAEVECEYYEALATEVSELKNRLVSDYEYMKSEILKEKVNENPVSEQVTNRVLSSHTGVQPISPGFIRVHNRQDGHLSVKQFQWLVNIGRYPADMRYEDCPLTYGEAYEILRAESNK